MSIILRTSLSGVILWVRICSVGAVVNRWKTVELVVRFQVLTAVIQPPADAGSSLADFSTLKMDAIRSSETSVHTRTTTRHVPENGILQLKDRFFPVGPPRG
jgi:hypothetical protein